MINPLYGEIWRVNLEPTVGTEIFKQRPCLIVNAAGIDNYGLRIVIPITEWNDKMARRAWFIQVSPSPLNGLDKESAIACHHIRSVDLARFDSRVGRLEADIVEDVNAGLKISLRLA